MNKLEKALFVVGCYAEAIVLNAFVIPTLEGIPRLVWIGYNVWIWCVVPVLVSRVKEEKR